MGLPLLPLLLVGTGAAALGFVLYERSKGANLPTELQGPFNDVLTKAGDPDAIETVAKKLDGYGFTKEAASLRAREAQLRGPGPAKIAGRFSPDTHAPYSGLPYGASIGGLSHVETRNARLAAEMLGLRGGRTHSHHPPMSHMPPRHRTGGWEPPGTGPFRPGPGSPTFGAKMPESHRPGVAFGPTHQSNYRPGHAHPHGMGVGSYPIGSRTRWHAVTHQSNVSGQVLSPAQIAELKQMMLAAVQSGAVRSARPAGPAPTWSQHKLKTMLAPMTLAERANWMIGPGKQAVADAAAAESLGRAQTLSALNALFQGGGGAPGGGGGSSPGGGASLNLNIQGPSLPQPPSLPTPSASASLSF